MFEEKQVLGTGKTSIYVAWQTQTDLPSGNPFIPARVFVYRGPRIPKAKRERLLELTAAEASALGKALKQAANRSRGRRTKARKHR